MFIFVRLKLVFTEFSLKTSLSSERKFHSFYPINNRDALRTMVHGGVIFAVIIEFSIALRRYSILSIVCIFLSFLSILINDILRNDVNYLILIYFSIFVSTKIRVDLLSNQLKNSYLFC